MTLTHPYTHCMHVPTACVCMTTGTYALSYMVLVCIRCTILWGSSTTGYPQRVILMHYPNPLHAVLLCIPVVCLSISRLCCITIRVCMMHDSDALLYGDVLSVYAGMHDSDALLTGGLSVLVMLHGNASTTSDCALVARGALILLGQAGGVHTSTMRIYAVPIMVRIRCTLGGVPSIPCYE